MTEVCVIGTALNPVPTEAPWSGIESLVTYMVKGFVELDVDVTLVSVEGSLWRDWGKINLVEVPVSGEDPESIFFKGYRDHVKGYDCVIDHTNGKLARRANKKVIQVSHWLQHPVSMGFRNVVCISEAHARWTKAQYPMKSKGPEVVYNGIDPSVFPLQEEKGSEYLFFCYDGETEVLTENGFKRFCYVRFDEKVATLNPNTWEVEYYCPVSVQKYKYEGEMIHFKGNAYDLLVTPNHKIYARFGYHGKPGSRFFRFITASELLSSYKRGRFELKRDAVWIGVDKEFFVLPRMEKTWSSFGEVNKKKLPEEAYIEARRLRAKEISYRGIAEILSDKYESISTMPIWEALNKDQKMRTKTWEEKRFPIDDWLEFFGWYISEGCTGNYKSGENKDYYATIIGQSDEEYAKEIEVSISKLGFNYRKYFSNGCYRFWIYDKQLFSYLKQFGGSKEKWLPKEIKSLPPNRLRILINSMMKGDGRKNLKAYTTASKRLADDFQEILLKSGLSGSIYFSPNGEYIINIVRRSFTPSICKPPTKVRYKGFVYDLTVPKNHIILVRRKGKISWSSNSVLGPYKGADTVMKLALEHPEYRFGFGGRDTEYTSYVREMAEKHENITCYGEVSHEEKKRIMGDARCLLQLPKRHDPYERYPFMDIFPMTIVEANLCGTPAIGLSKGGVPEMIDDGVNGYLCSDLEGVLEAMADLEEWCTHESAASRAHICRYYAKSRYNHVRMARDYLELVDKVIEGDWW